MNKRATHYITYLLAAMALLATANAFYIPWTHYSLYILGHDEAFGIINAMEATLDAADWRERLHQVLFSKGEHLAFGLQLIGFLTVWLTGHLDLQLYNLLPLVLMCAAGTCLLYHGRAAGISPVLLFAILFPLLLSPGHTSCAINTACTGNHYLGFALAVLSLHCFVLEQKRFAWPIAELLLALALASSPAALALVPVSFVVIYLRSHARLPVLALHTFVCIPAVAVYYFSTHADSGSSAALPIASQLPMQFAVIVVFFARLIGSAIVYSNIQAVAIFSVLCGIGIAIATWLVIRRRTNAQTQASVLFFRAGLAMVALMMLMISIGRSFGGGSDRYAFYACYYLAFLACLWFATRPVTTKTLQWLAIASLLHYVILYAIAQPYLQRIDYQIAACEKQWDEKRLACGVMIKHQQATQVLLDAEARGLLVLRK